MSQLNTCLHLLLCDFRLLFRRKLIILTPFLFLGAVIAFIPMAVEIDSKYLNNVALGFLLIFSIFVTNWVCGDFIYEDLRDGTLQFYQRAGNSSTFFFITKYIFCWLITGLPVVVIAAMIGGSQIILAFALATMINILLSLVVMVCSSTIKKSHMLVSFISLPFYLPVLVFSSSIISSADSELIRHNIYLLFALLLFMAPVAIFLGTYALKNER